MSIHFVLTYPDGRQQVADGTGDRFGSFAGPTAWPLDIPGVYRYQLHATWNGFQGRMPGLPEDGGEFYVYSATRPAGASGLQLDGPTQRTFSPTTALTITGRTTAPIVHYAMLTPGAVIEQGDIPVYGGAFQYIFNPADVHQKVPLYDIVSITTGNPQIGRVVHLTFFTEEKSASGASFFDLARVILRGTTAVSPRAPVAQGLLAVDAETPQIAAPGFAGSTASATTASILAVGRDAVRDWNDQVEQLLRAGDMLLVRRERDSLLPSREHERLQQVYRGVPVFGAEVTRQVENGSTVSIFGTVYFGIDLDPTPHLSAEEAAAAVERHSGAWVSQGAPPAMLVLPLDGGGYSLAWRVEARTSLDVRVCFVDASTRARRSRVQQPEDPGGRSRQGKRGAGRRQAADPLPVRRRIRGN